MAKGTAVKVTEKIKKTGNTIKEVGNDISSQSIELAKGSETISAKLVGKISSVLRRILHLFVVILVAAIISLVLIGVLSAMFYFTRETINKNNTEYVFEQLHNLQYEVPDCFNRVNKKKERTDNAGKGNYIEPETALYNYYDKKHRIIATLEIKYLGEDIDTDAVSERISKVIDYDKTIYGMDGFKIVEGISVKRNLSVSNILGDGLSKKYYAIATKDYSSFLITINCNLWNYSKEASKEIINKICIRDYDNKNKAKSLVVKYNGSEKAGYLPVKDDVSVYVEYKNGKRSDPELFQFISSRIIDGKKNKITVKCHGLEKTVSIDSKENETKNKKSRRAEKRKNSKDAIEMPNMNEELVNYKG